MMEGRKRQENGQEKIERRKIAVVSGKDNMKESDRNENIGRTECIVSDSKGQEHYITKQRRKGEKERKKGRKEGSL